GPERVEQLPALPLQEQRHLADRLGVLLRRDLEDAGRRTAADLMEDAGPVAVVEDVIRAGPELEVAVDDPQRLPDAARARIGAEVHRPVALEAAHHLQTRPLVARIQPQADEVLVVLEEDVERRLVALDELVLEEESLLLVAHHHRVDVLQPRLEEGDEGPGVAAPAEVGAHAGAEAHRLADVDDLAPGVLHEVDAGSRGEPLQLLFQRRGRHQRRFLPRPAALHPAWAGARPARAPLRRPRSRPPAVPGPSSRWIPVSSSEREGGLRPRSMSLRSSTLSRISAARSNSISSAARCISAEYSRVSRATSSAVSSSSSAAFGSASPPSER